MRALRFATRQQSSRRSLLAVGSLIGNHQLRFNATQPEDTSASATTNAPAEPTTEQQQIQKPLKKRFSSTVNFKIAPENVDSDNCPSAAEIKEMLPTAAELYDQLPTTAEVRQMYDLDRPGAGRAPPTPEIYASQGVMASLKRTVMGAMSKDSDLNKGDASSSSSLSDGSGKKKQAAGGLEGFFDRFSLHPEATSTGPHAMSNANGGSAAMVPPAAAAAGAAPHATSSSSSAAANRNNGGDEALWPDCDTPEDILNEERFGGEGDEAPQPTGEHVLLAWKALLYGTVLAALVTALCGGAMCWYMGFGSMAEVKAHLQGRKEREIERLKEEARKNNENSKNGGGENGENGGDVHVYEIDLTQPSTLMEQFNGLVKLVEDLAAAEAAREQLEKEGKTAASAVSAASSSAPIASTPTPAPASADNSFGFIDMRVAGEQSAEPAAVNPLKPTKRNYSL